MNSRILLMDAQFSSAGNSLLFSPIFDSLDFCSCIFAGVEFEFLLKPGHDMESAGIRNDGYNQFGGLDHEPDPLVIHRKIQPRLIQSHNVLPVAGLLCLKPWQKLSRQLDPDLPPIV
jgi:hypothetical protein